jgi:hypothetical protein
MLSRLIAYRHESIFDTLWPSLDDEAQENFMEELSAVDHDLMDSVCLPPPSSTTTSSALLPRLSRSPTCTRLASPTARRSLPRRGKN